VKWDRFLAGFARSVWYAAFAQRVRCSVGMEKDAVNFTRAGALETMVES
jgi:hypothetical protein